MRILLIIGVILFAAGWAYRSTVLLHTYANKPIGGILVTIGFVIMGIAMWRLVKK